MEHAIKSIRTFIGAKDFKVSRSFYLDLGFEETHSSEKLSFFESDNFGFYLQDYYKKTWVQNSMIFLEVDNVKKYYDWLLGLDLPSKYKGVKLSPIKDEIWGGVCFLHDPSGVLWQVGEFYNRA